MNRRTPPPRRTGLQSATPPGDAAEALLEHENPTAQARPSTAPKPATDESNIASKQVEAVSETAGATGVRAPHISAPIIRRPRYAVTFTTRLADDVNEAMARHRQATGERAVDMVDRAMRILLDLPENPNR